MAAHNADRRTCSRYGSFNVPRVKVYSGAWDYQFCSKYSCRLQYIVFAPSGMPKPRTLPPWIRPLLPRLALQAREHVWTSSWLFCFWPKNCTFWWLGAGWTISFTAGPERWGFRVYEPQIFLSGVRLGGVWAAEYLSLRYTSSMCLCCKKFRIKRQRIALRSR
jgi:hypothetical protein